MLPQYFKERLMAATSVKEIDQISSSLRATYPTCFWSESEAMHRRSHPILTAPYGLIVWEEAVQ